MIGRHPAMLEVYRQTRLAARGNLPVLIVGETGTGKELVARALHDLSAASRGPFIDINCAALPETLVEAELFGAERGAFTGATQSNAGFLERADGGTLFLDEACSLTMLTQAKLLRAIEQQEFWPVGGRGRRRSRFRLVAAGALSVDELLAGGIWRRDFAHRVSAFTITTPPLRARRSDVPELASHFLQIGRNGRAPRHLAPDALDLLARYDWPGNVRELKGVIDRLLLAAAESTISASLVTELVPAAPSSGREGAEHLFQVLAGTGWNTRKAARCLGISRATLYRRIKAYGLALPAPPVSPVS